MSKKEILTALSTAYGEIPLFASPTASREKRGVCGLLARLEGTKAIARLAELYSNLLEERVTKRACLHLLHAQMAGLFLLMPIDTSLAYRAVCLAWLVLACMQCKRHL